MRDLVRQIFTHKLPDLHPLNDRKPALSSAIDPSLSERADHQARAAFLRKHLVIQTHIPKTGGTALYQNLAAIFGAMHSLDVRISRAVPVNDMTAKDWEDIHFVSGHFNYGMHRRINRLPLYIAAVREPVDRAVSVYRYMQRAKSQREHEVCANNSFEDAWAEMDRSFPSQRRDRQAHMLLGQLDEGKDNWPDLVARIDNDYLLVMPQHRIDEAIAALREAFGLPKAPAQYANVSKAAQVTPSPEISHTIREANPLDARLYEHVAARFEDRLQSACLFIAERCLARHDG